MIEKIDHVGIAVDSIEEAAKLYQALGLTLEAVEEVPTEGVRVAMLQCGESRVELLEATREDSPIARFLEWLEAKRRATTKMFRVSLGPIL